MEMKKVEQFLPLLYTTIHNHEDVSMTYFASKLFRLK